MKALLCLFLLLLPAIAIAQSTTDAAQRTRVVVYVQDVISKGADFVVSIKVENITNLIGFQMQIDFSYIRATVLSLTEGTFLNSNGVNTFWMTPIINNADGTIKNIVCVRLSTAPVNGNGLLFIINCRATNSPGTFNVSAKVADLIDRNGVAIPCSIINGTAKVTAYPMWDLNQDGRIDILDILAVAQRYGERVTGTPDLNGDGKVDVTDIVIVAQHYGDYYYNAAPSVAKKVHLKQSDVDCLIQVRNDIANSKYQDKTALQIMNTVVKEATYRQSTTWGTIKHLF